MGRNVYYTKNGTAPHSVFNRHKEMNSRSVVLIIHSYLVPGFLHLPPPCNHKN